MGLILRLDHAAQEILQRNLYIVSEMTVVWSSPAELFLFIGCQRITFFMFTKKKAAWER